MEIDFDEYLYNSISIFLYIIETSHSLYIYLFGQHSFQKYLDRGIIIINQEGKPPITPPGKEEYIKMSKLTSSPYSFQLL